jgi:hypothetical protein
VYRLYSVEYYREVLDHLTPQGMMTSWLPIDKLSRKAVDRIIATFVAVFPHSLLFVGSGSELILLGSRQRFDPALLEQRFTRSVGARRDLQSIGVGNPVALLARILRMDDDLRSDVRTAPPISDQRNDLALIVTDPFDPARIRYEPRALLRQLRPERMAGHREFEETLTNIRRLRTIVPDLPRN